MKKSIALVLETHNLEGGDADAEAIEASLRRLFERIAAQTLPPDEIVITHRNVNDEALRRLAPCAARLVLVPPEASYYDAKNAGFRATSADVVVFGDSDCWPEATWLEQLLAPMDDPGVRAVAGRTTYRDDLLGAAASTIDFLYFDNPQHTGCTLNFYANNVAFERDLFLQHSFPEGEAMYRGHCQMLGAQLFRASVPIHYAHDARTIHRFPDKLRELVVLRFLRGRDLTLLAPHLAAAYLPKNGRVGSPRWLPSLIFGARLASSLNALSRDYAYDGGIRATAASTVVCALSALDWMGSLGPGALAFARAEHGGPVLSYHQNRDRLAETMQAWRSF